MKRHRAAAYRLRGGDYFVETGNGKGKLEEFRISHTFGFYPLQQYLVEFPDGRLQALSISWDSRSAAEGGQRWYHLYPDDEIAAGDPLHWTGAFQNWNSRCASCHTTNLAKNYSQETDTYATAWSEMNVGCEACHGAGSQHLDWAKGNRSLSNMGLLTRLGKVWEPMAGQLQIPAHVDFTVSEQIEVCAGCHSRRVELQQRDIASGFSNNYSLTPLLQGLYHPDGQILDEVYEAGSFLQSRMHQNLVSCTNCHEPHGNKPRVEGNGLCLQCHQARTFQSDNHFFHKAGSSGAQCVNCHMPERTYMGVDSRRDHSFRIPDPIASVRLGVPNACTQCHTDRTDQWAAEFITARTGRTEPHYRHASAITAARNGNADIAPDLLALAAADNNTAMLRSIALIESARFPSQRDPGVVLKALNSPDALLRMNAVAALNDLNPELRFRYLQPLLDDPVKSVRIAVAQQLTGLPSEQVPPSLRARFDKLLSEYEGSLLFKADMPESMSELGLFHAARGDLPSAERALLHARKLAPAYLPAMLNLSDVYRAQGRDDSGEAILDEALAEYPDSGDANYALGLLYVRTGRTPASVSLLQRASLLSPANAQYVHVYAVALAEVGRLKDAIGVLEAALQRFPGDPQISEALQAYRQPAAGRIEP